MVIALAGRPNVGKSSLFNRFVHRRRSLVWDRPGVTRDLIRGQWKVDGSTTIEVWDLAGVGREGISIQSIDPSLIKKIDVVLLIVDGSEPLTTEDRECIEAIRKYAKPILVAVNKCDKRSFQNYCSEISEFFPENRISISAETKAGLQDLEDLLIAYAKGHTVDAPLSSGADKRVLVLGRPNVGKSSLINAISGESTSFVSDQAGTTRDVIETRISRRGKSWLFYDTAGIRRKSKIYGRKADPVEIFSVQKSFDELKRSDFSLFVVEARSDGSLSTQDRKLLHLIRSSLVPAIILVNKWDLVRKEWTEEKYRRQMKNQLGDLDFLPILFVSAKTGFRVEKIFQTLVSLERSVREISTPHLNRWLKKTLETRPPRVAKRGHKGPGVRTATQYLHILYMVQTSQRPMAFQFFCNAPHAVAEEDKRFLSNRLRDDFSLLGVPLKLLFRRKTG